MQELQSQAESSSSTSAATVNGRKLGASNRTKLACEACRANKVRCIRPGDITPCNRCRKYGTVCMDPPVFKPKGRPPRRISSTTASQSSISISNAQPVIPFTFPDPNLSNQMQISPPNRNNTSFHSSTPSTYASSSTPRQTLNMAEYLDPGDKDLVENVPRAPWFSNAPNSTDRSGRGDTIQTERDDPISLQAISELEANLLVQFFHARLNPMVAVLDEKLHTLPYLRSRPILLSSILSCTSRFFRRDLHPLLSSHATTILDRATLSGKTDVSVVQSLMIATYWKAPEDTSAWKKIGLAIRLGYSFHWHVSRTGGLPDDEMEAREVLNAERTWFCLFSFDRGLSYVYSLPPAIRVRDHSDPEAWARSHTYLGPSVDMHIAASIQLCKLKDVWSGLCESKPSDQAYLDMAIENLTGQCDMLMAKWFNPDSPPPNFNQQGEHVLRWSILDFIFIMKRYLLETPNTSSPTSDPLRLDACLAVASKIAEEIQVVAMNGELEIMQDTASCMTSSLVVFLRKIFRHSTRTQKTYILSLLHGILISYTSVNQGEQASNTAPAFVSRFLRRILSALGIESRAGSPGPGAVQGDSTVGGMDMVGGGVLGDEPYDFFAEMGLEEFMQPPEYVLQTEGDDGQYWANIFSA